MQPPVPIDPVWQARIGEAYRFGADPASEIGDTGDPLLSQIEPLLGQDAAPDPTFFVDSWTVGVSAASESYLRRHEAPKKQEAAVTADLPSFSFVTFLNIDPAAFAPPPASTRATRTETQSFVNHARDEEETIALMPGPLTFKTACQLLGVAPSSTREQIRAAYRRMASRYHPDRLEAAGSMDPQLASDRMATINAAYRLLNALPMEQSA